MHAMDAVRRGAAQGRKQGMRGVTLIELMVVVVIIGILVAIAYPGYQSQLQKTRRADGKTALLNAAQRLERCFTRYNTYADADCDVAAGSCSAESRRPTLVSGDRHRTGRQHVLRSSQPRRAPKPRTRSARTSRSTTEAIRTATGTVPANCW